MMTSLASLKSGSAPMPPRILIHGLAGVGKTRFAAARWWSCRPSSSSAPSRQRRRHHARLATAALGTAETGRTRLPPLPPG